MIVVILGIVRMVMNKNKSQGNLSDKKILLKYIGIWVLTLVATMLVFKGPNMLVSQINAGTFSPGNFIKGTLLLKNDTPKKILAAIDMTGLTQQNIVDTTVINNAVLTPDQCKQTTFTKEELSGSIRKAITTNEDVGRYVGYGWKEITKGAGLNIGYGLLRLFALKDNVCYGTNAPAKLLCNNAQAIETFNIPTLQKLFAQVKPGTEAYDLLS